MTDDDLSRIISRHLGLDPRIRFCAHVYERRWRALRWFLIWRALDAHFFAERGERHHCRRIAREEEADLLINAGH